MHNIAHKLRPPRCLRSQILKASNHTTTTTTSPSSPSDIQSAKVYCANLLKKHDAPSYTLQTFIPRPALPAYLALRALNIELTLIADAVSTLQIGHIRLQFWREKILAALALQPAAHPVPLLLSHAIRTGASLPKAWLLRLISAREQTLTNAPYASLEALESYAENTYSTLLYLTLAALPIHSLHADHLASHIGKATGIVATLRGLPLLAFPPPPNHHSNNPSSPFPHPPTPTPLPTRQGTIPLPLDIMATSNVREEAILRHGSTAPGLRDAVFAVATRASDHLLTARQMLRNLREGKDAGHAYEHGDSASYPDPSPSSSSSSLGLPPPAIGVLLPAVSTSLWLERLEKLDFDVFRPELRGREWRLPWRAYWAYRAGRF